VLVVDAPALHVISSCCRTFDIMDRNVSPLPRDAWQRFALRRPTTIHSGCSQSTQQHCSCTG